MAGGGLSELICCSGKKSVEVLDTDDCLSIRVAAACFICSAAADKCLLPECLIEALFRQSKAGGAILRAVQAGSFFFFSPWSPSGFVPVCCAAASVRSFISRTQLLQRRPSKGRCKAALSELNCLPPPPCLLNAFSFVSLHSFPRCHFLLVLRSVLASPFLSRRL